MSLNVVCNFDLIVVNSKPSKRKLLDHVVPHVSTRWYDLGIKLLNEEYESHLDVIESSQGSDKKECCKKMLWYWLSTNTSATWGQLVEALQSPAVELPVVADNVKKLLTGEFKSLVFTNSCMLAGLCYSIIHASVSCDTIACRTFRNHTLRSYAWWFCYALCTTAQ